MVSIHLFRRVCVAIRCHWLMLKALVGGRERGPYSMLTIRKVVTPIRYDKSASISAIRKVEALKRVTSNALKRVKACNDS